jgi:hypothetical protein
MGVTGREILRWLAQDHILKTTRSEFETLLLEIAEYAEEWLTSAQAMARRTSGLGACAALDSIIADNSASKRGSAGGCCAAASKRTNAGKRIRI